MIAAAPARPVITGLGVVAPTGRNAGQYWHAALAGRSGIRRISRFDPDRYPARLAGQIDDFDASVLSSRLLPQTDVCTRYALVASDEALADAGIVPADHEDFDLAVVTASTSGGFEFGQRELHKLWGCGNRYVSGYQSFAWFYAVNTGQISIRHAARGPSNVIVADQAGGLDAFAKARRLIRSGIPIVLTGGFDSVLSPWGWTATLAAGDVSTADNPHQAYLPFTAEANGFVPGEGGALAVLEDPQRAGERGARLYAELAGHASGFDPRPGLPRPPALGRVIHAALCDAEVTAEQVDVVFADAAGSKEPDRREADALVEVFGERAVAVAAPKTAVGRLFAGGGPLDVATAALSLDRQLIPPAAALAGRQADPRLDLVTSARPAQLRTALVLARGKHGFTSAVVLTKPVQPASATRAGRPAADHGALPRRESS